jgi:hypothetical protein
VIDHPKNLGYPSMWRVDGQGMINPSPSLKGAWKIGAGKEVTFRYRLLVHKGAADPKIINAEQAAYTSLGVGKP